ncbi:alpha-ketoacid dehydrogenase subunit beta [Leisingera aquaemixtae]|uniref:Pyruvate dehydrogenase E1 component subunit beta n=1 Tax=Leisingera aquaemixtae TaxID=1396826 RepID=A0A0P1H5V9_9RHOB|nr:alpha-ketoacid dehydrogenase subunit beta [Leisingera aquaemixtae]CUH98313.1 Pyruvate dehydrogenase E1 component subunit beta [Leisingera aquaemixtae]
MTEMTLIEAVRAALPRAMEDDPAVLLLGEDIGPDGGVFRATEGLWQRFGRDRVRDTPLSEAGLAGAAVGLAVQGFRPVAEIQFQGFIHPALDQIANHAARMRNRTRGRLTCPLVLRAPFGAGVHAPEHHSESIEALFAHIPGLKVVIPSSPAQAYGLLLSAIRDPDPVVFFEPKRLYRASRQEVAEDGAGLPLGRASLLRQGRDLTIVTWGASVKECQEAAQDLAEGGISAEILDLATLKPYDAPAVLASVRKTGRCVIVHEAPRTGGFGAEIAACIAEQALEALLAPVRRVAAPDIIPPLARLEHLYLPGAAQITAAAREVMSWH